VDTLATLTVGNVNANIHLDNMDHWHTTLYNKEHVIIVWQVQAQGTKALCIAMCMVMAIALVCTNNVVVVFGLEQVS
jgi:hypothetical protein